MDRDTAQLCAEMHKAGIPLTMIAEKIHVDRKTIYNGWKRHGIDGLNRHTISKVVKKQYKSFYYADSKLKMANDEKREDCMRLLNEKYEEFKKWQE